MKSARYENIERLVVNAMNDLSLGMSPRIPDVEQTKIARAKNNYSITLELKIHRMSQ